MLSLRRISRRHLRIAAISLTAAVVAIAVIGFLVLPPIIRSVATSKLSEALHRPVTIQEVRLNPFALSLTLRGFKVGERQGPETFVGFDELYVNAELSSIPRWGAVLKEIRLTRPAVRLVRHAGDRYNFSDLLDQPATAKPAAAAETSKPTRFSLNNIQIVDGRLDFVDEPVQKTHTVRDLHVGIPFISNIPSLVDIFVEPRLEAKVNDDPYSVAGKTKPFADSLESTLQVDIRSLDIPKYLAYSPVPLKFKVPSGQLDIAATIVFLRQKAQQTLTVQGDVTLKGFTLTDRKDAPVVSLPTVAVAIAPTRPLERKVHIAKVSIQSPELAVRREKGGLTNVEALLPDAPKNQPAKATAQPEPAPAAGPALSYLVDTIELVQGKVGFVDASLTRPFKTTLQPIDVRVSGLGNEAERRGAFSLSVLTEAKEQVQAEGEVTLTPITATVKAATKGIVLAKYAPYYRDRLRFDVVGKLDAGAKVSYAATTPEPTIQATDAGLSLSGLKLRLEGESDDFLRIPALTVSETKADVGKRELTIGTLVTQKGYGKVTRFADGGLSLSRLLAEPVATAAPASAAARSAPGKAAVEKPWVIVLSRATVDQYAAVVDDRAVSPPTSIALDNVRVTAEKLSTAKGAVGKVTLGLTLDRAATVAAGASVGLEPLKADGKLDVKRVPLKRYAPYYRDAVLFDIQDGVVDLGTSFAFAQSASAPNVKLAGLTVGLENLRLQTRADGEEFLVVPSLSVRNTDLDLGQRQVKVGELATQRGMLRVSRSADGKVNVLGLVPATPPTGTRSPAAASASPPPAGATGPEPATTPATPWRAQVGAITIEQYGVAFKDHVPADPVTLRLDDLRLKAQNLTTEAGKPGTLALGVLVEKTGSVSAEGSLSIAPVTAELQLDVKQVAIRPLQPYFTDRVKIVVDDGNVSTAGRLSVALPEREPLKATYAGNLLVSNLATVDKQNGEDVLRWESLSLGGLEVATDPMKLHLTKVALAGFYARTIIQRDGTINLTQIRAKDESAAPAPGPATRASARPATVAPAAPAPASNIKLDEVTLQGGRIVFTDRTVTPNYSATLVEMGGRISGLSSAETTLADVDLRGRYENHAPLQITGKINPLRENLYVDLKVRYTDMDLSPVSPYSGKYIGYAIQKGKLSLDLEYLIDGRKLNSKNRVFLDQLTLGDKVESPTATRLPVSLAIALLKDRKGEIHLDLPVSGSLDDPKFSVWAVIVQVLTNLLTKAATSPMALLGAVFGSGEELRNAEFEYGTTTFTDGAAKRVETLAKALRDRPGVKLDITARVDPERDREALRKALFERKVRAQKALDVTRRGSRPVSFEQVTIEPKEYEKYLRMAYDFEKFPKPRTALGLTKTLPVEEMEKLMNAHIQITPEDLRALASDRAEAAKDALVSAQIPAERIFIVEPGATSPDTKADLRLSRVDFVIK